MPTFECAFERTQAGIVFLPSDAVAEDHPLRCELRVTFTIASVYGPERDVGAGITWDGDIDTIEWMTWGNDPVTDTTVRHCVHKNHDWRYLEGETYEAAKSFLLRYHGDALWQHGDERAEEVFYGEAA